MKTRLKRRLFGASGLYFFWRRVIQKGLTELMVSGANQLPGSSPARVRLIFVHMGLE